MANAVSYITDGMRTSVPKGPPETSKKISMTRDKSFSGFTMGLPTPLELLAVESIAPWNE